MKLQNKLVKFLTAADKKKFEILFFTVTPTLLLKKNCSFPDALGTSRPIFKLLGVTEVKYTKEIG